MKYFSLLLSISVLLFSNSYTETSKPSEQNKIIELTEEQRQNLIIKISTMGELDQKYRTAISIGTLDSTTLKKDKEMRMTSSIEEYMSFIKTIKKTLNEKQIDSLWKLQHKLDYKNYQDFKSIVQKYGYPSKQRLKVEEDNIYPILLHPPVELKPSQYLNELMNLLHPEVLHGRMDPILYATFVDNIKSKILKQPQLYGTNKPFNPKTMSIGLPIIDNLKVSNQRRLAIGLPELKEGEFELSRKVK